MEQTGYEGSQPGSYQQPATITPQPNPADKNQQYPSVVLESPDTLIRGKIISADPQQKKFKLIEFASGYERLFKVMDSNLLKDVKKGDSVRVTPDVDDPNIARDVKREPMNR